MKFIKDLLSERSNASMMRLMSFIVCITACYIAIRDGQQSFGLVGVLLSTSFGAKVGQKFAEKKEDDHE